MRLLHVLAETGYSGGEGQLRLILEHFIERGHHNEILLQPNARFEGTAKELGLPVHYAPLRRFWRPDLVPKVRRAIARATPDVLHFACSRSLVTGGLAAMGRTAKAKVTIRRIDYPIKKAWGGLRYRRFVDHTVAICDAIVRRLRDGGVPDERITRIYDGIDPAPWLGLEGQRAEARRELGIPADAQVISEAGVLRPRKGQHVLIEAFASLASRFPRAVLFLAGGGGELERLRAMARERNLEQRIFLPGPVCPVQNVYAASDIFCMPSFHEGLCNACLEASFAGLPQVVSTAGGNAEIVVDGHTGAVVRPGDSKELASAIECYLEDPELARTHGANGRERSLSMFTKDHLGPELEALFGRLVGA